MGSIGNIPMCSADERNLSAGAAFLLGARPADDATITVDGSDAEVKKGNPFIVVRAKSITDATAAFDTGHAIAQKALDMMSIRGLLDTVIRDAEDEHLIWWTCNGETTVRSVSTSSLNLTVKAVGVSVKDKDGNTIEAVPSAPKYHVGFRFFRLAQATEDLFDAYRNMYLAFEALLSSQFPKTNQEREIDWLKRSLTSASTILKLNDLGVTPSSGNPASAVIDKIYTDARLPLFHAKDGKQYFAPQESNTERKAVASALEVLTTIVLRMAESWFNSRRRGGGVFLSFIYRQVRSMAEQCSVYASNYDGACDAAESDLSHPRFSAAAKLTCEIAGTLERDGRPAIRASASGVDLEKMNPLRRIELASDSAPYVCHILEAPLDLNGIQRFESLMHVRAMNTNQPRSFFRR